MDIILIYESYSNATNMRIDVFVSLVIRDIRVKFVD